MFQLVMKIIGTSVDSAGVLIILAGMALASYRFLRMRSADGYRSYRQDVGRSILLGLEFLVAGDIIRTVVVAPTLDNVIVLAIIVLIRTFLSSALEMELEGRWPWQRAAAK